MGWRPILLATIALPLCLVAELLPIRSYTTADGLAADLINKIVVDSRGFVWFCTPEGLSRFDGYRLRNFGVAEGLPSLRVNALFATRSGEYLVATGGGLCQFQARGGGRFTTYLPGSNRRENNVYTLLRDSTGRIWCGTGNGLFEMRSDHMFRRQRLPAPLHGYDRTPVEDILEDAGGKLWLATPIGIDVIAKDGFVVHIGTGDGLPNEWVQALLLDKQDRLWAGTRGGLGLMRDGSDGGRVGVQRVYRDIEGAKGVDGRRWRKGRTGPFGPALALGSCAYFPTGTPRYSSF
jgi:ligand-binding sensor domain-containing protein